MCDMTETPMYTDAGRESARMPHIYISVDTKVECAKCICDHRHTHTHASCVSPSGQGVICYLHIIPGHTHTRYTDRLLFLQSLEHKWSAKSLWEYNFLSVYFCESILFWPIGGFGETWVDTESFVSKKVCKSKYSRACIDETTDREMPLVSKVFHVWVRVLLWKLVFFSMQTDPHTCCFAPHLTHLRQKLPRCILSSHFLIKPKAAFIIVSFCGPSSSSVINVECLSWRWIL